MDNAKQKALIIANCQVQPLKHALSLRTKGITYEGYGVHLGAPAELVPSQNEIEARKGEFRFVLSFSLSEEFGKFSRSRIEETFHPTPVMFITNLYFSGLHPDVTYLGGLGTRLAGPTGDYHSKIAAAGFASGLTVNEIIKLYSHDIYNYLGYYDEFNQSIEALKLRDDKITIKFADRVETLTRSAISFFSMNHPSAYVTDAYADIIAEALSEKGYAALSGWNMGSGATMNYLAASVVMPVYPEICKAHHLPYAGSYNFKTEGMFDEPATTLNLEEFVRLELKSFSAVDPSDIANQYPINLLLERCGSALHWERLSSN